MMRTITVAGHFKQTQWRAIAEAIINLLSSIAAILICKHFWGNIGGLYGALIGTIISMLYRTIDINIYANKKILKRSCWGAFKVMLTNAVLFVGVVFLIRPIVPNINNYFSFILNGIWLTLLVLAIFVLTQALFNLKETRTVIGYFRNKIKAKKSNTIKNNN